MVKKIRILSHEFGPVVIGTYLDGIRVEVQSLEILSSLLCSTFGKHHGRSFYTTSFRWWASKLKPEDVSAIFTTIFADQGPLTCESLSEESEAIKLCSAELMDGFDKLSMKIDTKIKQVTQEREFLKKQQDLFKPKIEK